MSQKEWYEARWEANPLDWRTSSNFLLGLEKQQEQLKAYIRKGKPILLFGPTGTGKSTLLQRIAKDEAYLTILLNGDRLATQPRRIAKMIKGKVSSSVTLCDKPVIVLLDEATQAPKGVLREIKGLFDDKEIQSFILAQISNDITKYQDQFRSRIISSNAYVETSILSDEDLVKLIDKRLDGKSGEFFELDAIKAIARFGKIPRLVLDLCSDVLDNVTGIVTFSDVQELIRQRQAKVSPSVTKSETQLVTTDKRDEICSILSARPNLTREELEQEVKQISPNSVGRMLIKLLGEKKIMKSEGRPARYSVEPGYALEMISDRRG